MKILNEFGITPTNTYVSAGADFYVPNISKDNEEVALNAFKDSYNQTNDSMHNIVSELKKYENINVAHIANIVHLYLALDSSEINDIVKIEKKIEYFVNHYLIYDKNGIPGIDLKPFDMIKINSGIRVALENNTAGIFFNKSGKGTAGFDVRAQVVDEDYTGFVHLSLQYCRQDNIYTKGKVFCGDKITQMVILPIKRLNAEEVSKEEYFEIMKNSQRGSNAFGHSDIKH